MKDKILYWLANGQTGVSSKTIAFEMVDIYYGDSCHPLDPADFHRCIGLIHFIPEIKTRLNEMKSVSPQWRVLVDNWNQLEKLLTLEIAETGKLGAPKTYNLMQELYKKVN